MAELFHPPYALLFFYCVAASLIFISHAGNLSFAFPPQTDIEIENSAYIQGNRLQLTANEVSGSLGNNYGWGTYNNPIPLWDKSSRALANFSTHFQFIIGENNNHSSYDGDGLAFFMVPFQSKQPFHAVGGGLGLFNDTTSNASYYQMVAVEFDTHKNPWDPDDNHVGIDVSSIFSRLNFSLSNSTGNSRSPDQNLKNGEQWDAWVDYDGGEKRLQVFLLYNPNDTSVSKPGNPLLSYDIDLRDILPEYIRVGLSASTGAAEETHTVNAWNFSCEYSWETSPNNASIGVIIIFISVFCIVCGFIFVGWRWNFRKSTPVGEAGEESDVELDEWFSQGPRRFSYADLSAATRNFCDEEKLGQGGFGSVYRGILPGTTEAVAVKRISQGSKQGRKEYVSEVTIISKLRHRNLVRLLGWCHQKGELLLVYEYLPNGSLDKYIFCDEKGTLDWNRRYSIACDIASALVYLHEEWDQRVVHRDIKASNVMLDSNFNAKLGDFGLARLLRRDQAASQTTVVAGTYGYLAPECIYSGKASPESDVFSFGAVTLEIACGKRPLDLSLDERLVEWVWDLHGQGRLLDSADQKLDGNFKADEMERLLLLGLLCSHPDPKARPKMREVVKILKFEVQLPDVPQNLPVAIYDSAVPRCFKLSSIPTWYGTCSSSHVESQHIVVPPDNGLAV